MAEPGAITTDSGRTAATATQQQHVSSIPPNTRVDQQSGAAAILHTNGIQVFAHERRSGDGLRQDLTSLRGMKKLLDSDPGASLAIPGEHKTWGQALRGADAHRRLDEMIGAREKMAQREIDLMTRILRPQVPGAERTKLPNLPPP